MQIKKEGENNKNTGREEVNFMLTGIKVKNEEIDRKNQWKSQAKGRREEKVKGRGNFEENGLERR